MAESQNFIFMDEVPGCATYDSLYRNMMEWYFQHQIALLIALVLSPFVILCLGPFLMLAQVYVCALYLKLYRYYHKVNGYTFTQKSWETARNILAHFYYAQARFWYGYEVEGLEHLPKEGSALIVFYHGAMPVDWYYLLAATIVTKKRIIPSVGDRFLFKIPAFDGVVDCFEIYPATVDMCIDILQKGNVMSISPGGVREALFGDENYPIMWEKRKGFAKVALEAKVPIIPMFTQNIREAFFTLNVGKSWLRGIYERTRIPLVPIFGGLPVKLKTILGEPIPYDPDITHEELAEKVAERLDSMIKKHQHLPGSVFHAVLERFQHLFKRKQ